MAERIDILGVGVHALNLEQVLARLDYFVQVEGAHQVVTINPEFVMRARRERDFRETIQQADLATADGVGITLAGWMLGTPFPGRVTGVELTWRLAELAAAKRYRLYLLGAGPGVAERAAQRLQQRYPDLIVAGTYAGSPAPEDEEEIVARVHRSGAQILLVAYGAPQQDLWLRRNLPRLGTAVGIGVGGTLDYISGVVPRAPSWMRNIGLEWLYRLWHQPQRWRRMLNLPLFAGLVLRQAWRSRRRRPT
ncbi:MAG: WecB/TagA/CpsF family glycosyltransferase [Chloroflexia bacterium]|nr:WecB/TagA/CpsF family glycosyltransferase [Chloroflexia bacterium]